MKNIILVTCLSLCLATHGDDKNKKWNKEKWAKAAFFSELAANYSTVYQVWCKHRGHKKRMSKD